MNNDLVRDAVVLDGDDAERTDNRVAPAHPSRLRRGDDVELADLVETAFSPLIFDEGRLWLYDKVRGVWTDETVEKVIAAYLEALAGIPVGESNHALKITEGRVQGVLKMLRRRRSDEARPGAQTTGSTGSVESDAQSELLVEQLETALLSYFDGHVERSKLSHSGMAYTVCQKALQSVRYKLDIANALIAWATAIGTRLPTRSDRRHRRIQPEASR